MSRVFDGREDDELVTEDEISIFDRETNKTLVFKGGELESIEWDGYPDTNPLDTAYFMIEVADDVRTFFVDYKELDERARNAILDYCEGVYSGSIEQ